MDLKVVNYLMNLLFLNVTPLPHSIDLHKNLQKKGHNVEFYYLTDAKTFYPWKNLDYGLKFKIIRQSIKGFLDLKNTANKSDVVVITGWHSVMHVVIAIYCFIKRIQFSFWLDVPQSPKLGVKYFFKRILLKLADGYFITGEAGFDFFEKQYGLKSSKFYNFPYMENKPVEEISDEILNEMVSNIKSRNKIRLLISSRFLPRKGYDTVFETFKILSPTIANKYRVDIYLHASNQEPYGIPPMDAMARGKVVIGSTGVYSCLDRIIHKENGLLFKAGKSNEIEKCLKWIVENPEFIYKLCHNALIASEKYNLSYHEKVLESFVDT